MYHTHVFLLMQVELEKLNSATDDINKLESKLEVSFGNTEIQLSSGMFVSTWIFSLYNISTASRTGTTLCLLKYQISKTFSRNLLIDLSLVCVWLSVLTLIFCFSNLMKFNFFNCIFYLCFKETNNVFSSTFAESTARLKAMGKKLGSCIEKARPYYEAQELARTSQLECQRAAVQYQRANGTAFTSLFSSIVINYSCNVSKTIIFLNE